MSGKILISCRQATEFISKNEEKKLTLSERIQLLIHLIICEFCKLFYKQNDFIINNVKEVSIEVDLLKQEQEEMTRIIDNSIDK